MASSHVGFEAYSYEPPSYEEAQARGPLNQTVYKPTVSQNTNVVIGGLRPLYTPNGYNGFSDYNTAKRRRRMRIACATLLAVLSFMLFVMYILNSMSTYFHHATRYDSSYYDNKEDSEAYPSYKDSSVFSSNADYDRNPVNDDYKQQQLPKESVVDRTELGEHNNDHIENNGNHFGLFDEIQAMGEKYNLIPKPIVSSSENPVTSTDIPTPIVSSSENPVTSTDIPTPIVSSSENPVTSTDKVTEEAPYWSRFSFENLVKDGIVNPKTGEIDEDKLRQLMFG